VLAIKGILESLLIGRVISDRTGQITTFDFVEVGPGLVSSDDAIWKTGGVESVAVKLTVTRVLS
jgi:hypothetical protein